MPFQVSPGVNVSEIDLTTVVPAVSSTEGAIAGAFRWGPVDTRSLVSTESELAARFGKPTSFNAETFFTAANFLAYGNKLYVARAAKTTNPGAITINIASNTGFTVGQPAYQRFASGANSAVGTVLTVNATAVTINSTSTQGVFNTSANLINASTNTAVTLVTEDTTIVKSAVANSGIVTNIYNYTVKNTDDYDYKEFGATLDDDTDVQYIAKYPGSIGNSLKISVCDSAAAYSSDQVLAGNSFIDGTATKATMAVGATQLNVVVQANAQNGVLTVTNISGTWQVAETIYQSNGTANVAMGTVSAVNSTAITVSSTTGQNTAWALYTAGSYNLVGATSAATARVVGRFVDGLPTTTANTTLNSLTIGDVVEVGNSSIGKQYLKVTAVSGLTVNSTAASFTITTDNQYTLATAFDTSVEATNKLTRKWEYYNNVSVAPGTSEYVTSFGNTAAVDEVHIVVVDEDGEVSGIPGTVVEVFSGLSRATDAKTKDGAVNYYKTVINDASQYVWFANDRAGAASAIARTIASSTNTKPLSLSFNQGQDGSDESTIAIGDLTRAYDLFASAEDVDVSLILAGKARGTSNDNFGQLANYLIDNVAEKRKDCVVFISPDKDDVVRVSDGSEETNVVNFRNTLRSTSYAVLDSGYKYQYDKYNDVYRWIPLNGDTGGLCVRTDDLRDPWWSPAGFNRGQIKNVVKLAFNPDKAERDVLYKAGVNPVVAFPGQGVILFGDKTLLNKPSAFDRINVRRLFIVLEKAVATAAKFTLFEFNDDFTRAQFRALVEPFLRDVQGRRGIYDFKVVCDTTNNTGEVIDRNEFVGDIYIKPAKSINFIQLNFVAVRTGVDFTEVVGKF